MTSCSEATQGYGERCTRRGRRWWWRRDCRSCRSGCTGATRVGELVSRGLILRREFFFLLFISRFPWILSRCIQATSLSWLKLSVYYSIRRVVRVVNDHKIRAKPVDQLSVNLYVSQDNRIVGQLTYPIFEQEEYASTEYQNRRRVDNIISSCWSGQQGGTCFWRWRALCSSPT